MTIEHIVLIEWSSRTTSAHRSRAQSIAASFEDRIPGVLGVVQGPSVSPEGLEGGHDFGMLITFADELSRDEYLPHPVHQEFVALLADGAARRVTVFDLEVGRVATRK